MSSTLNLFYSIKVLKVFFKCGGLEMVGFVFI